MGHTQNNGSIVSTTNNNEEIVFKFPIEILNFNEIDYNEDLEEINSSFDIDYDFNDVYSLDFVGNIMFGGIDWIYTSVEALLSYDFKVWYIFNDFLNFNENFDMFFNQYWAISLSGSIFQLFYAIILDKYLNTLIFDNLFNSDWFRIMLHSKENSFILLYHPELSWHFNDVNNFLTFFFNGSYEFIYLDKTNSEKPLLAYTLYIHLIILFFIFSLFITILFSFYGNPNTEENTIDSDYLSANSTIEAEKEITSIDDYLGLVFIIAYVFGIFFYIHAWTWVSSNSALMFSYYCIFLMFFFILGMPTLILYDLGIFFLAYLKGAGKNPNSYVECIFDYIACIVFYTRILAQWVRIVLMLITFLSLSHFVAEFDITNNILIGSENQSEGMYELNETNSTTYYILTVLPGKFIYWIYELLHTLFLVSSQFIAFFAIVFWLFLFLYTFFIIEKHEDFFSKKRDERKKKLKDIYNLKSN